MDDMTIYIYPFFDDFYKLKNFQYFSTLKDALCIAFALQLLVLQIYVSNK